MITAWSPRTSPQASDPRPRCWTSLWSPRYQSRIPPACKRQLQQKPRPPFKFQPLRRRKHPLPTLALVTGAVSTKSRPISPSSSLLVMNRIKKSLLWKNELRKWTNVLFMIVFCFLFWSYLFLFIQMKFIIEPEITQLELTCAELNKKVTALETATLFDRILMVFFSSVFSVIGLFIELYLCILIIRLFYF